MMTRKKERFYQEYPVDFNATKAAIRAGFSKRTAYSQGQRLLKDVEIQAEISRIVKKLAESAEINAEWVLKNLKEIAERCMQKVPVMKFDRESKSMKQVIDEESGEGLWQFDSSGANRSLELIGRRLGMFKDKSEHSGSVMLLNPQNIEKDDR